MKYDEIPEGYLRTYVKDRKHLSIEIPYSILCLQFACTIERLIIETIDLIPHSLFFVITHINNIFDLQLSISMYLINLIVH